MHYVVYYLLLIAKKDVASQNAEQDNNKTGDGSAGSDYLSGMQFASINSSGPR